MNLGELWVGLGLDDKDFQEGIKKAEATLGGFGKKLTSAGGSMSLAVTAPLTLAGGYIFKFTKDWEENMAKINTTAQLPQAELEKLSQTLKDLGGSVNADMSKVPVAYEKIISQTGDAALSTEILEAALKGAKAGFTDLDVVAGAIAQSLSAVGAGGASAQEIIDTLFAAKRVGAGEFEDFANYIPQLIAAGKNLGVNYQEVAGAFAYMTGKGNDAASSAMLLQNAFSVLGRGEIQKGLQGIGVSIYDADGKMRSLVDIFGDLKGVIGNMTDQEVSAFYESIGLVDMQAKQAFSVLTSEVGKLEEAMDATKGSAGELETAMEFAANKANTFAEAKSMLQQIALGFGDVLLPAMNVLIAKLNVLLKWVSGFDDAGKKWVVGLASVAAAIGPVLMGVGKVIQIIPSLNSGMMSVVKTAGRMSTALMANPYILVGAAIVALIAIMYSYNKTQEEMRQDWEALKKAWTDTRAFEQIMGVYKEIFGGIWKAVTDVISVFQDLLSALGITVNEASAFEVILRAWLVGMKLSSAPLRMIIKLISTLTGAVKFVVDVFKDLKNLNIEDIFNKIGDGIRDFVQNNPLTDLGRSIKEVFTGATEDSDWFQDAMKFDFNQMKQTAKEAKITIEDMAQSFADSFEGMSDAQRASIKAVRLEYLKSIEEWIDGTLAKIKAEGFFNQNIMAQMQALDQFAKDAKAKMDASIAEITASGGGVTSFIPVVEDPKGDGGAKAYEDSWTQALQQIAEDYKLNINLAENKQQKLEAELTQAEALFNAYKDLYALDGYTAEEIAMLHAYQLEVKGIQVSLEDLEAQKTAMANSAQFKEGLQAEIQALRDSLLTQTELYQKAYNDQLLVIQNALNNQLITETEAADLRTALYQRLQTDLKSLGDTGVKAFNGIQSAVQALEDYMIESFPTMMGEFGAALVTGQNAYEQLMSTMLDGIQKVINALFAQAIAAMIAGESAKGVIGLGLAAIGVGALKGLWESSVGEVQGLATGGSVYKGGVFEVGEDGPEMVTLPKGAAVTPNHLLNAGGVTQIVGTTLLKGRDIQIVYERASSQSKNRRSRG